MQRQVNVSEEGTPFSYQQDRVCSTFSDAVKFCLANGLRQLTHDIKNDLRTLNSIRFLTYAPQRKMPNVEKIVMRRKISKKTTKKQSINDYL